MNHSTPDWKDILLAAHNEPLDPAHYTALRARVLAELERRRRDAWRRWLLALAPLAAALVLFLALPLRPTLPPLPKVAFTPPAPNLSHDRQGVSASARQPARPPRREPTLIKLQTADPNIVIYWIAD